MGRMTPNADITITKAVGKPTVRANNSRKSILISSPVPATLNHAWLDRSRRSLWAVGFGAQQPEMLKRPARINDLAGPAVPIVLSSANDCSGWIVLERWTLRDLERSILFSPGFPKRNRVTFRQFEAMSKAEQAAQTKASSAAITRARHLAPTLEAMVRRLGKARYASAVPLLARLWRECALVPVWVAVGHALSDIATAEAWNALEEALEDSEWIARHLAVGAMFARDAGEAYEALAPRFARAGAHADPVCVTVLDFLSPDRFRGEVALRILNTDRRWPDLCATLRRDERYGALARDILLHVDPQDRDDALGAARDRETALSPPAPPRTHRDGRLLARYEAGAFDDVWREIRAFPSIDDAFRAEVLEVAEATMRRVAANADLIAERLCSRGWRALSAGTSDLRTLPAPADADILCRIENITGAPIPPTLLAFWKIVGGVNWVWDYETGNAPPDLGVGLPMQEMDPLCVDPPKAADYLFDKWEDQRRRPDPDLVGSFELELAPDYLHKANISGGAPYSIALPFLGADPKLANESHGLPFVDYLRPCFRWAGFPGLEGHARRDDVRNFIAEFTAGLAPF